MKYNHLISVSAASFLGALLQLLTVIILSRILSPIEIGQSAILMIVINFLNTMQEMGTSTFLIQHNEFNEKIKRYCFSNSLFFSLVITILYFIFISSYLSSLKALNLLKVAQLLGLILPLMSISSISNAILSKQIRFGEIITIQLITQAIGNTAISIFLAYKGYGFLSIIIGQVVTFILSFILLSLKVKPIFTSHLFNSEFKLFQKKGAQFTISTFFNYIAEQADTYIVGKFLGAEALGYYNRAFQLFSTPSRIIGIVIDRFVYPKFAKLQNEVGLNLIDINKMLLKLFIFSGLFAFGIFIFSEYIIYYVLGRNWVTLTSTLQIFCIAIPFRISLKLNKVIIKSIGLSYQLALNQIIFAISVIILSLLFYKFGINGVASAVLISSFLNFLTTYFIILKKVK